MLKFLNQHKTLSLLTIALSISLLRFWPFIFGQTLFFGDNYSLMVPGKIFTAQWLQQGVLPLWNPYLFTGLPWLADINQSVLYPTTLLFIFFSPAIALNLSVTTQLMITFIGMYFLAKKWLGSHWRGVLAAVVWSLSSQVAGGAQNLTTLQSLAWFPWLAFFGLTLAKSRKSRVLFSVCVLLQFLGGYPQHVVYAGVFAVSLSARHYWGKISFSAWFKAWAVTGLVSLLLSAFVWVPFLEVFSQSTRVTQSLSQAVGGSFHPVLLIKTVIPTFFDSLQDGVRWGPIWNGGSNPGFYVPWLGVVLLAYSLIKSRKKYASQNVFFASIILISILLSLGDYLPGFGFLQKVIPILRFGRNPSMILIGVSMLISLWLARAFTWQKPSVKIIKVWVFVLSAVAIFAGSIYLSVQLLPSQMWSVINIFSLNFFEKSSFHTSARDMIILRVISRQVIFSAVLSLGLLWAWLKKRRYLLIGFVALEMVVSTQSMLGFAPKDVYSYSQTKLPDQISKDIISPDKRVLTRNGNLAYTDFNTYWEAYAVRQPFSDSFIDEEELRGFSDLKHWRDGLGADWNIVSKVPSVNGYTTLLPLDYAQRWESSEELGINSVSQISLDDPLLKQWSVGYYLVDNWFDIKEDLSEYSAVAQEGDWTLYELPALSRFRFEDDSPVKLDTFVETPNEMRLSFRNNGHKSLIIADRYDKNWQAVVNGRQMLIEEKDGMRQVEIKPGKNKVALQYQPRLLYFSSMISLLTLGVISIVLLRDLRNGVVEK